MAEKTPNQQLAEKLLFKPAYVNNQIGTTLVRDCFTKR